MKGTLETTDGPVPHDKWKLECGCGFYGFWLKESTPGGVWEVMGVVEGTGRTIRGPLGFRASKAQIVGLHIATGRDQLDWLDRATKILHEHYAVPVYPTEEEMLAAHPPTQDYLPPLLPCGQCQKKVRPLTAGLCRDCYYHYQQQYNTGGWLPTGSPVYYIGPGNSVHYVGSSGGGGGFGYTAPYMPMARGGAVLCPQCGHAHRGGSICPPIWQAYSDAGGLNDKEVTDLARNGFITPQQALDYLQERKKKMDAEEDG
jgi:hypothetical protein